MIVNNNMDALIACNKANAAGKAKANAMGKLSSGSRINEAADDAAGSSISQKMRAQIRGLEQADKNIQDGGSLIQTAEAGLASIENPNLIRMREIALQALNGTLTQEDRAKIQNELDSIKAGIDNIANNTEFNGIKLLNRENGNTLPSIISPANYEVTSSIVDLSKATSITIFEITGTNNPPNEFTYTIDDLVNGQICGVPQNAEEKYYFSVDLTNNTFTTKAFASGGYPLNNITGVRINGLSGYDSTTVWGSNVVSVSGNTITGCPADAILGSNLTDYPSFAGEHSDTSITINFEARKEMGASSSTTSKTFGGDLILQVGANFGDTFNVKLTDARTSALGIDNIDITTHEGAEKALEKIDNAMETISKERGKFGAYQNTLEHICNNVGNYGYNITSAESRISDADMAKEVMEMAKNSIIEQSAQSILKQSENMPQSIIDLMSKWKVQG